MEEAKRERRSLTAAAERRVLSAMARAMPAWVTSDGLTMIGVIGAVAAAAGYALSASSPHWLWLASAALVANWFGDSLDGTLARIRKTERPRYGYYIDHGVDAFTTTIIGVGIGLSPFLASYAALVLVILYLILSINVYLESTVYGVFRMDYGLFGPTEVRLVLILLNTALILVTAGLGVRPARIHGFATVTVAGLAGLMSLLLFWRFFANLRRLRRLEPLERGRKPGDDDIATAGDRPASGLAGTETPVIPSPDRR
jgi:phosphatidylglycerophosphate synthase